MALIAWSSTLSTGIEEQDNQHRKLIDMINRLNDAAQAGKGGEVLGKVFAELMDYTVYHFGYEEKLMIRYGYSDTQAHRTEHVRFMQTIGGFKQKFDSGGAVAAAEIVNFLRDWLTHHIMKTDRKLGLELAGKGAR